MYEHKVCNCAGCGKELVSTFLKGKRSSTDIAGRIKDRPYCAGCLETRDPPAGYMHWNETSPSWDNAIRAMEER